MPECIFDHTRIKELRTQKSLTIEEFALQLGTQKQQVSAWETGVQMPRVGMLVRMCNTFKVPISFFVRTVHHSEQQKAV